MYPEVALGIESEPDTRYGLGNVSLLDVPQVVAEMGIPHLEICHFHFPRVDAEYIAELRGRLAQANVQFLTLLIDTGDITSPDPDTRARDLAHIRRWIEIAAQAGARQVRVIAGDAQPDGDGQAIKLSVQGLAELQEYADSLGVGVITENWHQLATSPCTLLAILNGLQGKVGLCADFGNYSGQTKYDDLAAILPLADTIHAKGDFRQAGVLEREDYERCLDLSRDAGFSGQYVLIFDGPGEEQPSLRQLADVVQPYL